MSGKKHRNSATGADNTATKQDQEQVASTGVSAGVSAVSINNSEALATAEFVEEEEINLDWVGVEGSGEALGTDDSPDWAGDDGAAVEQEAAAAGGAEAGEEQAAEEQAEEEVGEEVAEEEAGENLEEALPEQAEEEDQEQNEEVAEDVASEEVEVVEQIAQNGPDRNEGEAEEEKGDEGGLEAVEGRGGQGTGTPNDLAAEPTGDPAAHPSQNQANNRSVSTEASEGTREATDTNFENQLTVTGGLEPAAQVETPEVADVVVDNAEVQGHIDTGLSAVQAGVDAAAQQYNDAVSSLAVEVQSEVQGTVDAGVAEIQSIASEPMEVEALPDNGEALAELDGFSSDGVAQIQKAGGEADSELVAASQAGQETVSAEAEAGSGAIQEVEATATAEIEGSGEVAQSEIDGATESFAGEVDRAVESVDQAVESGRVAATEAEAAGIEGAGELKAASLEATAQGDAAGQSGVDTMTNTADAAISETGAMAGEGMAHVAETGEQAANEVGETGANAQADLQAGGVAGATAMGETGARVRGDMAGKAGGAIAAVNAVAGGAGAPGVSANVSVAEQAGGAPGVEGGGEVAAAEDLLAESESGGEMEEVVAEGEEDLSGEEQDQELVPEAELDIEAEAGGGGEGGGDGAQGGRESELGDLGGEIEGVEGGQGSEGGEFEGLELEGGEQAGGAGGAGGGHEVAVTPDGDGGVDITGLETGGGEVIAGSGGIEGGSDVTFEHEVEQNHPEIGDAVEGAVDGVQGNVDQATQGAQDQIDQAVDGVGQQVDGAVDGGEAQVEAEELSQSEILDQQIEEQVAEIDVETGLDLTEMIAEEEAAQDVAEQSAEAEHEAIDANAEGQVAQVEEEEQAVEEQVNQSADTQKDSAVEQGQTQRLSAEELAEQEERAAITNVDELKDYLETTLTEQSSALDRAYEGGKASLGLTFDGWRMALAEEGAYAQLDIITFMRDKRTEVDGLVDDKTSAIEQAVTDQKTRVDSEMTTQTAGLLAALQSEEASVQRVAGDLAAEVRGAGQEASTNILAKGKEDADQAIADGKAAKNRIRMPARDRDDPNNLRDIGRARDSRAAAEQAGVNAAAELNAAAEAAAAQAIEVAEGQAAEIEAMGESSSEALNGTHEEFVQQLTDKVTEAYTAIDDAAQSGLDQLEEERTRLKGEIDGAESTALDDIRTAITEAVAELDQLQADAEAAMDTAHEEALAVLEEKTLEAQTLLDEGAEVAFEELKSAVLTCVDEIQAAVDSAIEDIDTARETALTEAQTTWQTFRTAVDTATTTAHTTVDETMAGVKEKLQGIVDATLPQIELVGKTAKEYIRLEGEARVTALHDVGEGIVENLRTSAEQVRDDALAAVEGIETQFDSFLSTFHDGIEQAIADSNASWDAIVAIEEATAEIGEQEEGSDERDEATIGASRVMADQLSGLSAEQQAQVMEHIGDDIGVMMDNFSNLSGSAEPGKETYEFVAAFTQAGESLGQDGIAMFTDIVAGNMPEMLDEGHDHDDHEFLNALQASIEQGNGALFGAGLAESLHQDGEMDLSSAVASKTQQGVTAVVEDFEQAHGDFAQKQSWMDEWMLENVGTFGSDAVMEAQQAYIEQFSAENGVYEDEGLTYEQYEEAQAQYASILEGSSYAAENWGDNEGMTIGEVHTRGYDVSVTPERTGEFVFNDMTVEEREEYQADQRAAGLAFGVDSMQDVFEHVPTLMQESWVLDEESGTYVQGNLGSTIVADALLREAGGEDTATWLDTASRLGDEGYFDAGQEEEESDYELPEQYAGADRIEKPSWEEQFENVVMLGGARASELLLMGQGGNLNLGGVGAMADVTNSMTDFIDGADAEILKVLSQDLETMDAMYAGQTNIDPAHWAADFNGIMSKYNAVTGAASQSAGGGGADFGPLPPALAAFTGTLSTVANIATFTQSENRDVLDHGAMGVSLSQGVFGIGEQHAKWAAARSGVSQADADMFTRDAASFGRIGEALGVVGDAIGVAQSLQAMGDGVAFDEFLDTVGNTSMLVASASALAGGSSSLIAGATGVGTLFLGAKSVYDAFGALHDGNASGALVAALPAIGATIGLLGGPMGAGLGLAIGSFAQFGLTMLGVGQPDPNKAFETATEVMWKVGLEQLVPGINPTTRDGLAGILRNVDGDGHEGYGPVIAMISENTGISPEEMFTNFAAIYESTSSQLGPGGLDNFLKSVLLGADVQNADAIATAEEARANGWDVEIPGMEYSDEDISVAGNWMEHLGDEGFQADLDRLHDLTYDERSYEEEWVAERNVVSDRVNSHFQGLGLDISYDGDGGTVRYDEVIDSRERQSGSEEAAPYKSTGPGSASADAVLDLGFDPMAGVNVDVPDQFLADVAEQEGYDLGDPTGRNEARARAEQLKLHYL